MSFGFVSGITGKMQPYRLFVPSSYNEEVPVPLLVALHGTGGDQDKYFDHPVYSNGIYIKIAEKTGFAVLCPLGNDELDRPTEWRGTGEVHVFEAIEDVCKKINVDRDRIVLTGQSMGGTGTTYLCCRYPDFFAAGIPLASTYGHITLVSNLEYVPMLFVQGEKDWPIYAKTGPIPLTDEMKRLGYNGELWFVPDSEHNTMAFSTERVFEFASVKKRVKSPSKISHRAYLPAHGKAWWVDITKISVLGKFGQVDAHVKDNRMDITLRNVDELIVRPDNIDHLKPLLIYVDSNPVYSGTISAGFQVRINKYVAEIEPLYVPSVTERLNEPLFFLEEVPTWSQRENSFLGNLLSDTMKEITNSDIALVNRGHYMYEGKFRGAVPDRGIVTTAQFIDWLRPLDSALAVTELKGSDILKIIELNLDTDDRFIIQGAGFKYTYDPSLPKGSKVTDSDIDKDKIYRTVFKLNDIRRTDTMILGDLYDNIDYVVTEENTLSAVWNIASKNHGILRFSKEKRVTKI